MNVKEFVDLLDRKGLLTRVKKEVDPKYEVSKKITEAIKIPTIGIGAGPHCDGQVLVCYDMLGCTIGRKPKFVKTYANLREEIIKATKKYAEEVEDGTYPSLEYSYEG